MVTILSIKTGLKISLLSLLIVFILLIAGASTAYATGLVLSPTPDPNNLEVILDGHVYYSDGVTPWPHVGVILQYYPPKSSPVSILMFADEQGYYSYTVTKGQLLNGGGVYIVTRWVDLGAGITSEHVDDIITVSEKNAHATRDFVTTVISPVTPTPTPPTLTATPTTAPIITPTPVPTATPTTVTTTAQASVVNNAQASPSAVPSQAVPSNTQATVTATIGAVPSAESPSTGIPMTYAIIGVVVIVVLLVAVAFLLGRGKR